MRNRAELFIEDMKDWILNYGTAGVPVVADGIVTIRFTDGSACVFTDPMILETK